MSEYSTAWDEPWFCVECNNLGGWDDGDDVCQEWVECPCCDYYPHGPDASMPPCREALRDPDEKGDAARNGDFDV